MPAVSGRVSLVPVPDKDNACFTFVSPSHPRTNLIFVHWYVLLGMASCSKPPSCQKGKFLTNCLKRKTTTLVFKKCAFLKQDTHSWLLWSNQCWTLNELQVITWKNIKLCIFARSTSADEKSVVLVKMFSILGRLSHEMLLFHRSN